MTKKKSKSQKKHRQVESKKVKKPSISLTSSLKKFFSSRSGGIVLNLSLLLISLSVLFIILEVGARIIIKPDLDKWFVGPSYDFEKWNDAHGIHGAQYRESSIYFYTNRINILGLGDSFTFASGVYDFEKTHLKLLENKLISRGIPSGINNVAYPGNNILDIVESARKHISLVKPDIVLYSIVLNDPTNKAEQKPEPLQINLFPYICKSLEKHSYFYFYINSKFKSLIQGIFYPEHTKNFYDRLFTNENLRLYENQLVGLKSLAERNNAELIAIILPVMDNFENYQFMDHHKKLEEILDNNSITYVDLLPRFLSVEDTRSLWVNPYDSHPNDIAQEIIAEGAAVFLSKHIRENYSDKLSSLPAEGKKQLFHSDATFKVAPEGRRLISEGKFEEAIRIFKRSLQNEPDNFLLYHWIARCHINKGDIDEGIRHLENCISISPEYADAYVLLSEAYQLKKMNSRAKECLNAALKIIPDEAEIYYELSMILEKEEDYSGALDMIKKAVELEPNELDYRCQLAAMKMNNSDVEEA
ncbi:MAG: tetratricopeptide repeat protein, partial [bacterium]|nr:tetratricopeptide repeat protein [bacterium]